jgi:hypothetical protein
VNKYGNPLVAEGEGISSIAKTSKVLNRPYRRCGLSKVNWREFLIKMSFLMVWFGLWCLTPLSTIFQLYNGDQIFIGRGNRSTRRKPATCCTG